MTTPWCARVLSNCHCPAFLVQATKAECDCCRASGPSQAKLADRAVEAGVDRGREVHLCAHRGRVLQGFLDGCCKDGREVPTLVECRVCGEPRSVYGCYSCKKFEKLACAPG
jgi:hypothetical protein